MKHWPVQNNKVHCKTGSSQGGHVGHCSKMTSLYEYFFKSITKARHPRIFITPIKMSGYTITPSLSAKHFWNRYH